MSADKYRIDGHKLIYHPQRICEWMAGERIYPIYMEICPSGSCNHRCVFCGFDFLGYQSRFLDPARLKEILLELSELGLKSVMYAGEGEPFLHRQLCDIVIHTHKSGIDVALATNGVLMTPKHSEKMLGVTEWIKVSCNAGTPETYSKIHQTKAADFDKVIENLRQAVKIKNANGYSCTLGVQILLLPENQHEVERLAAISCDIGLDYLVVKPYSQHPQSPNIKYNRLLYGKYISLAEDLKKYNTNGFNVIFRLNTMKKWDEKKRSYKKCTALPFWSYMDAGGNIWGCSIYVENDRFFYGNIKDQDFQQIWESRNRQESLSYVENELDTSGCRINCRLDAINQYLWELKNPPVHVNFI